MDARHLQQNDMISISMNVSVAVIIATRNRPKIVSNLLDALAQQTARPDTIIISACNPGDVEERILRKGAAEILFGSPGLTAQRNRALSRIRGKCDVIVFFDDDFIPSRFWLERARQLLETSPDVSALSGRVLADGVKVGEIEWTTGKSIVDKADSFATAIKMSNHTSIQCSPYGCNMAFRASVIDRLEFDERLVLYGWLEDMDFGFRAAAGSTILTDFVWGVHLGNGRGRTSGKRFGYSQVVNPWYLMTKGTMPAINACIYILRALSRNAAGTVFRSANIDRWGRLKGNMIGVKDIIFGRWAPENVIEL